MAREQQKHLETLILRQMGKCIICDRNLLTLKERVRSAKKKQLYTSANIEVAHINAFSKGGKRYSSDINNTESIENLVVVHIECHRDIDGSNFHLFTEEELREKKRRVFSKIFKEKK